MRLIDLVDTTEAVAATAARGVKIQRLAELLKSASGTEMAVVVGVIAGNPRQGRIGVGWAAVDKTSSTVSANATLNLTDLDDLLTQLARTRGKGAQGTRRELLESFLTRCTEAEADFVRRLLVGELRQGANEGIVTEAVAKAAGVPSGLLKRAVMLSGDLATAAEIAMRQGRPGLKAVDLRLHTPIRPMLASTAASVADAIADLGSASVEWKLDGIRIQVHKQHDRVRVWTRNLNDITERVSEIVETVAALPAQQLVLDGEALGTSPEGAPLAFQDTMSNRTAVDSFFFDLLHHDGVTLIDEPLTTRLERLESVVGRHRIPGIVTDDPEAGQGVLDEALTLGHEGVMVKAAGSVYNAGRRGNAWRKVKPVHRFDLVVLAVEHGSGRRQGMLSNIHLGARGPDGGFVMVGKTFKGMTDQILRWQTKRFGELAINDNGWVVRLRPIQVVEVAIDGVQHSTRYPGAIALRFARVVRYRHSKPASEADTLEALRALSR